MSVIYGLKLWLKACRAKLCPISIIPVIVAGVLSHTAGFWRPICFWGTLFSIAGLHGAANLWNDYHDDKNKTDRLTQPTPFSGGSRVIQDGLIPAAVMYRAAVFLFVICGITLLWVCLETQPWAVIFLIGGLMAGWSYSAPPFRLAAKGYGEIAVGLAFGPLLTGGVFLTQTGYMTFAPLITGGALGLLVMIVLCLNEIPDRNADKATEKNNWSVRLNQRYFAMIIKALLAFAYIVIVLAGLLDWLPRTSLGVLVTVPWAIGIARRIKAIRQGNYRANRDMVLLYLAFSSLLSIGLLH